MGIERIKVGDVCIEVFSQFDNLELTNFFHEADDRIRARLEVEIGFTLDGSIEEPKYKGGYRMSILLPENNTYSIMRYIGYLTSNISKKYRFCHAAGLILGGKGVMLTGNSGNGKSTLVSALEGEVLDDDMLLVSPIEMRRICKIGGKRNIVDRKMQWLEDDNYQSPLHYIFVLNNQYDPDHVVELQPQDIKPETTFDDKLHSSLLARYSKRMPIPFEIPVYEIGTKREPAETKRIIESIVSS